MINHITREFDWKFLWRQPGFNISRHIDDAAVLGNWSKEDKIHKVATKLRSPASLYYNSNPDFLQPDM